MEASLSKPSSLLPQQRDSQQESCQLIAEAAGGEGSKGHSGEFVLLAFLRCTVTVAVVEKSVGVY